MNPPGFFENGKRVREYSSKNLLPLSGKLIPDFANRQTIREMFVRRPRASQSADTERVQTPTKVEDSPNSKAPKRQKRIGNASQPPSKRAKQEIGRMSSSAGQSTIQRYFSAKSNCDIKTTVGIAGDLPPCRTPPNFPGTESPSLFCTDISAEHMAPTDGTGNPSKVEAESTRAGICPIQPADDDTNGKDKPLNKGSWSRLFQKKTPPKCEGHDELCISLVTKKAGINQGRSFWICPRPLGPSGNKEVGTEWRCPTFIWCSDRNGE